MSSGYTLKFYILLMTGYTLTSYLLGFSRLTQVSSYLPNSALSVGSLQKLTSSLIRLRSYHISPNFSFMKDMFPLPLKTLRGLNISSQIPYCFGINMNTSSPYKSSPIIQTSKVTGSSKGLLSLTSKATAFLIQLINSIVFSYLGLSVFTQTVYQKNLFLFPFSQNVIYPVYNPPIYGVIFN